MICFFAETLSPDIELKHSLPPRNPSDPREMIKITGALSRIHGLTNLPAAYFTVSSVRRKLGPGSRGEEGMVGTEGPGRESGLPMCRANTRGSLNIHRHPVRSNAISSSNQRYSDRYMYGTPLAIGPHLFRIKKNGRKFSAPFLVLFVGCPSFARNTMARNRID